MSGWGIFTELIWEIKLSHYLGEWVFRRRALWQFPGMLQTVLTWFPLYCGLIVYVLTKWGNRFLNIPTHGWVLIPSRGSEGASAGGENEPPQNKAAATPLQASRNPAVAGDASPREIADELPFYACVNVFWQVPALLATACLIFHYLKVKMKNLEVWVIIISYYLYFLFPWKKKTG